MLKLINVFRRPLDCAAPRRSARALGDIVDNALPIRWRTDFERVDDLSWVSQSNDHIRHRFNFHAMKGLTYAGCWGASIDFVPKLMPRGLAWKRNAKSTAYDIVFDPVDLAGSTHQSYTFEAVDEDQQVIRAAHATFDAASADFSQLNTLDDVIRQFEKRSRMNFERFSPDNYVQTDLAWGLALIAVSRAQEAEHHIKKFCEAFEVHRDTPLLLKAMEKATEAGKERSWEGR